MALKSSADVVERALADVSNVVYYIGENPDVLQFLDLEPLEVDMTIVSDVLKAQKQLQTYTVANSIIKNIQLYAF